jgi:hypothetical protein
LTTLCEAVSPLTLRLRFVGGARPFELSWDGPHGPVHVTGESPDSAAREASHILRRPRREGPVTDPHGETSFAEAMRELIELTPAPSLRARLRLVR